MWKLILLYFNLLLAITCQARIVTVDDDSPADFNNIQAAIDDANKSDVIIIMPGTYTGLGNRDINFCGKTITIRSTEPHDPDIVRATIIDCCATETNRHRAFYFRNNECANCIIDGLTITNGYAPKEQIGRFIQSVGGAIFCESSSPTISRCVIENNYAYDPYGYGAGVFCYNSNANIKDCTFTHNTAMSGAGIYCLSSSPSIVNCVITENKCSENGGGIRCYGSSPQILSCKISNNGGVESAHGGGIECYSSSPTITGCTITGNSARWGGGIYCGPNSSPMIANCIICDNTANTKDGGAIYGFSLGTRPKIRNCTICANSASGRGGGICFRSGRQEITNCIIWGNTAPYGSQICEIWIRAGLYGALERIDSTSYSDVQNHNYPGPGNIYARPGFVDSNNGDYHLKSQSGRWDINSQTWIQDDISSPCIDAGDPNSDWTGELWPHGKHINMGAFGGTPQASMSLSDTGNVADLNNDESIDYQDLMLFAEQWLSEKALLSEDLNRNGIVDHTDFIIFSDNLFQP